MKHPIPHMVKSKKNAKSLHPIILEIYGHHHSSVLKLGIMTTRLRTFFNEDTQFLGHLVKRTLRENNSFKGHF